MTCIWLSECRQAYGEADSHIGRLLSELTTEQLGWKPAEDSWSIVQCIGHLDLTREAHLPLLKQAIDKGKEKKVTGGEAPYGRGTAIGRWILGAFEKPKKLKTIKRFRAVDDPNPDDIAETFRESNAALIALTEQADGLDLGRLRVAAPASGLLRLSLAQGFELHVKHDARHLAQAEAVREDPGFPTT